MAMTPEQMIVFFRRQAQQSKEALVAKAESSDYHQVAFLIWQGFQECLMEGLICWRFGLRSPVEPIREAVVRIRDGVELLTNIHAEPIATELPLAQASIVSFLVEESPVAFDPGELEMDCLLDAALAEALRDRWNETMWGKGLRQLRVLERSALSFDTYSTYYELLRPHGSDTEALVEHATAFFEKRRHDEFYIGGPQTEGGDLDSMVTVDYRLAAILKRLGYNGDNMHRWRWG